MTKKALIILVLVIAAGLAVFFLRDRFHGALPISDDTDYTEPLPFSYATVTKTYKITVENIPATGNKALDLSVRRLVDARIKEFTEMYAPETIDPVQADQIERIGYLYEQYIKATPWSYKNLDGMHVEEYSFTGGAHGGTVIWPFTYDKEGNALSLKDLFTTSDYLKRVSEAVRPLLKEKLETGDIYVEDMFLTGTEASEGNYFVFKAGEEGITFSFAQYQIAPYAAGMPEVTVPFEQFEGILSPKYF